MTMRKARGGRRSPKGVDAASLLPLLLLLLLLHGRMSPDEKSIAMGARSEMSEEVGQNLNTSPRLACLAALKSQNSKTPHAATWSLASPRLAPL
ncbi:hypothetical protein [Neoaquamicrobium sediminum]|uniref:hypothetical protein n=1 Tax=Neoaquamicrobium sediminum TaxID=1849104 RepID=UPI0040352DD4